MSRLLDKILVVDVESTCWEGGYPQKGQMSEIIEVGLCSLDIVQLRREDKCAIMVKPMKSHINEFCTELTSITPDMVEYAKPLSNACAILEKEYDSRQRMWASWGDYDRNQFQRNCNEYGIRYPFGPTHLNVRTLFSITLGMNHKLELDQAFRHLGWKLDGPLHRGVDDAWNTAKILAWLLNHGRNSVEDSIKSSSAES